MESDIISQRYNSHATAKCNLVWTVGPQLAWKKVTLLHGSTYMQKHTNDPKAIKVIMNLTSQILKEEEQTQNKNIYVRTGQGPASQMEINEQVKEKFTDYALPNLNHAMEEFHHLAYSYINQSPIFKYRFTPRGTSTLKFNFNLVPSFFAQTNGQKQQIKVNYYHNKYNFCISIAENNSSHVIYILKSQTNLSLDEVIQKVMDAEKQESHGMNQSDMFEMPIVEINCSHQLKQIEGMSLSEEDILAGMTEGLQFKLEGNGIKEGGNDVLMTLKDMIHSNAPRYFVLDKTFWLIIKQKHKHPYICLQIVNPQDP